MITFMELLDRAENGPQSLRESPGPAGLSNAYFVDRQVKESGPPPRDFATSGWIRPPDPWIPVCRRG